ncbi:MAG TPA: hypothetical protein VMU95_19735 [Trebonia sp.]|nr:hypothetical protein [Trebonia sp.]
MQHYAALEIIRQHTGELREQARRDEAARQVRKARHGRKARSQEARWPGEADWNQGAGAEVVPMPRVPDYVDGTYRDTEPHSHAC